MLIAIPIVHGAEYGLALVYRENRAFGEHVEVFVGYDRRNLDDEIGLRFEAGHFQIDPNEILGRFHGVSAAKSGMVAEQTEAKRAGGGSTVLASYGRGVLVQADGTTLHCALSGRKQRIVCGDRVAWAFPPSADGPSVQSVEPRRNLIERIDARGRAEPVAANIDRLAIVVAAEPAPDWFLVDRYWAGAALKDLDGLLIVNKRDLGTESIQPELETYRALRLNCVEVAAQSGTGMADLERGLARRRDASRRPVRRRQILAGQRLDPGCRSANRRTDPRRRGAAHHHHGALVRAGGASAIIDAPGVRDFAPPASLVRAAERGFVEIHAAQRSLPLQGLPAHGGTRLRRAHRRRGPGNRSARRYESYRRLFRLYEKLAS